MVKSVKTGGLTLHIDYDEFPLSPRETQENLGKMLCWHQMYNLGDKNPYKTPDDFHEDAELQSEIFTSVTVYGLDHGGIRLSYRSFRGVDPYGFDSGVLGVIYATKADVLREYGELSDETKIAVKTRLAEEIEVYDEFLNSSFYCFRVEGLDGENLDSCGNFSGGSMAEILKNMKRYVADEHQPLFDKALSLEKDWYM